MIVIVQINGYKRALNLTSGTAVKNVTNRLKIEGFKEISDTEISSLKNKQFVIIR